MSALVAVALPLARSSEGNKAGPIGLAVILILCIACYFLFKSMSKHLRTVRENFPSTDSHDGPAVHGGPVAGAGPFAAPPTGTPAAPPAGSAGPPPLS